jgi:mannosyltransferase
MPKKSSKTTKFKNEVLQSNPKKWLPAILMLGLVLRVFNLTAVALWNDEAFSEFFIHYHWGEMMRRISLDVHPPLYYIILRFWSYLFGSGLFALRFLSVIFGILTIYLGYLFVKEAFKNEKLAVLSALFLAINPFQIAFAQEMRMYTLGTLLILLSSYLLAKALNTNKTSIWIYYGVSVAACFYTHYYLFFSVAAQGLYFLFYMWREKKFMIKGLLSYVLSVILFLPWIPTLIQQILRVETNYWIQKPNRFAVSSTFWSMTFGGHGTDHITLTIITPIVLALVIYFYIKSEVQMRWLLMLAVFLPVICALALSFKQAIYLDRYFVFASLYFSIMIAATFFLVAKYTTRRTLTTIFIVASVIIFLKNWADMGWNTKPGMKAAAAYLNGNARPNDKIYVGLSAVYFTFEYYNQTPIKPLLYSPGPLETIPNFAGTALLNDTDLVSNFAKATKSNDVIWLLWTTGFYGTKPNVPGNWQKIDEKTYADTPWYKGDIIITEYHVD